jgi:hypothetical protein
MTAGQSFQGLVIILFCIAAWIGIQHLGYVELGVASRMFMDGAFRRMLSVQIHLQQYEDRLAGAQTPEDCWLAINDASREFGFTSVQSRIGGTFFTYGPALSSSHDWEVSVPLGDADFVTLYVPAVATGPNSAVGPFANMLQRALAGRPPALQRSPERTATAGAD